MKQLILNSDDFGFCHSANMGVVEGFTKGILTQASLMAPTPWFEEAVALTKQYDIPVGVHLTAISEWDYCRWRPLTGARSLTCPDGTFHSTPAEAVANGNPDELEAEFTAQVELIIARGIRPQHIDVHVDMVNAEVFAKICRRFQLPGILPSWILSRHPELREVCYKFDSCLWLQGQTQQDWPFFDHPMEMKTELFQKYLQKMPEGIHYNACHLSVDSDEITSVSKNRNHPWARYIRVTDLELICRPEFKELCEKLNIQRTSMSALSSGRNHAG